MWPRFLLFLADKYLRRQTRQQPVPPLAHLDPQQIRRVLLLNFTALGDLLFSTPAIRALKETYPAWRLDLLLKPSAGPLMHHNPHVERIWLYPGRGAGLLQLMHRLGEEHYDLAIVLHGNDPEATLLASASRAPFIIGSAHSPLAFVYAARVERANPYQHAIERRLDFVRLVGADTEDKRMELFLPPQAEAEAAAIIQGQFGPSPARLMALHPTGSAPYKWWPLESYIELGKHLYERYRAALFIISGTEDRPVAEALAARLPGPTLVTGGRYPLPTVAALLKRAQLLVANDSGPLHMALALGVPSLALIGADHPARIGPYQVDWGMHLYRKDQVCQEDPCLNRKCPDNRCMQAITVPEVVKVVTEWWEPLAGN
jgi:ADP-heptose:LPS heptosyltransferase